MELPIELDSDFGGGEEEDLSPAWLEAARVNVNDDPALRAERLEKFRESLGDHKIRGHGFLSCKSWLNANWTLG